MRIISMLQRAGILEGRESKVVRSVSVVPAAATAVVVVVGSWRSPVAGVEVK